MSHVVTIETEVRDVQALQAACRRLKLQAPVQGTHRLFGGEVAGVGVQLPNWKYLVVCQLDSGELAYDNYGGRWGMQAELDQFLQAYAAEKAKLEARRNGHAVTEQLLANGSIKLTIQVGGTA